MAIADIIRRGYAATIGAVITRGYTIGEDTSPQPMRAFSTGSLPVAISTGSPNTATSTGSSQ